MADLAVLSIKIDSTQVSSGTKQLEKLERQATATDKALSGMDSKKATDGLNQLSSASKKTATNFVTFDRAADDLNSSLGAVKSSAGKAATEIKGAGKAANDADGKFKGLDDSGKKATSAISGLKDGFAALKQAVIAYVGIQAARELAAVSDEAINIDNKLKQVTSSQQELNAVFDEVSDIAQRSRSSLGSVTDLYQKLVLSSSELNVSQSDLLRITETVSKTFALSGATAQEADGAIRQLGQGLASGALRGDEFNSIAEQAPLIMRAIAKETGLTIGGLREFAATGGITADIVIRSLQNLEAETNTAFAATQQTSSQAVEAINNDFIRWARNNDNLTTTINAVTGALGLGAKVIQSVVDVLSFATSTVIRFTEVTARAAAAVIEFGDFRFGEELGKEFVEARVFALSFVGAIEKAMETVKLVAGTAAAFFKLQWERTIAGLKTLLADFISFSAGVIGKIPGAKDLADSLKGFSAELVSTATPLENFNSKIAQLTSTYKNNVGAIDDNIVSLITHAKEEEVAAKATATLTTAKDAQTKVVNANAKAIADSSSAVQKVITGLQDELNALTKTDRQRMIDTALRQAGNKVTAENAKAIETLVDKLIDQRKTIDDKAKAEKAAAKIAEDHQKVLEKQKKSFDGVVSKITMQTEALTKTDKQLALDNALREANVELTSAQGQEISGLVDKLFQQKEAVKDLSKSAEAMGDTFSDIFAQIGDELGGLGGEFGKFGKTIGSDLFKSLDGVFGKGGSGISGLLSGDLSGLKGIFGDVAGGLKGLFSGQGGGILDSITGLFSGGGSGGLGGLLGGLGQAAGSALGNIGGGRYGDIGASLGGLAGNLIPIPVLGPAIGSAIGGLIGGFIGPKPTDSTQISRLDLATGATRDTGSLTGEKFSQENRTAADTSTALLNQVAQSLGGITGGELSFIVGNRDGIRVEFDGEELFRTKGDVNAALDFATEKLFELSGKTSAVYKALAKEGETLGAAFLRIDAQFEAVDKVADALGITFDLTGEAGLRAADQLVTITGGLDAFVTKSQFFAEAFTTGAEKWESFTSDFNQGFEEIGVAVPATREAFKELVQSQDLTTEAGQRLAAELLNIAPAADLFYQHQEALVTKQIELLRAEGNEYEAIIMERNLLLSSLDEETKAIQEQIFAAQDRAQVELDAANTQKLQIELLRAQGKESEALALTREMELEGLSETDKAIKQQIFDLQDQADVTNKAAAASRNLTSATDKFLGKIQDAGDNFTMPKAVEDNISNQIKLLELQGKKEEALALSRNEQLKAASENDKLILKQIFALEDRAAIEAKIMEDRKKAFDALGDSIDSQRDKFKNAFDLQIVSINERFATVIDGLESGIDSIQTNISSLNNVIGLIDSALGSTKTEATLFSRQQAQAVVTAAVGVGKAGGSVLVQGLEDAVRTLGEPSSQLFGSFEDFLFDSAVTANNLKALRDQTEKQLTGEEKVISLLEQQIMAAEQERDLLKMQAESQLDVQLSQLDAILSGAEAQLHVLDNINNGIFSVEQALSNFNSFVNVPGFANGTNNSPAGIYMVGERGPELMSGQGANITSNSDLRELLNNEELRDAMIQIRDEIRRGNVQIIKYVKRSYEIADQWDNDGLPPERT